MIIKEVTLLIIINPERTKARALLDANRGHGLMSTRWNGLNFFFNILVL